jgi:hypothetical protein
MKREGVKCVLGGNGMQRNSGVQLYEELEEWLRLYFGL